MKQHSQCNVCNGLGRVSCGACWNGQWLVTCPVCCGRGKCGNDTCLQCKGTGKSQPFSCMTCGNNIPCPACANAGGKTTNRSALPNGRIDYGR